MVFDDDKSLFSENFSILSSRFSFSAIILASLLIVLMVAVSVFGSLVILSSNSLLY